MGRQDAFDNPETLDQVWETASTSVPDEEASDRYRDRLLPDPNELDALKLMRERSEKQAPTGPGQN